MPGDFAHPIAACASRTFIDESIAVPFEASCKRCATLGRMLTQAFEDRRAEFGLEPKNTAIDRRRGNIQLRRGFADRAAADHFIEISQCAAVQIHERNLSVRTLSNNDAI